MLTEPAAHVVTCAMECIGLTMPDQTGRWWAAALYRSAHPLRRAPVRPPGAVSCAKWCLPGLRRTERCGSGPQTILNRDRATRCRGSLECRFRGSAPLLLRPIGRRPRVAEATHRYRANCDNARRSHTGGSRPNPRLREQPFLLQFGQRTTGWFRSIRRMIAQYAETIPLQPLCSQHRGRHMRCRSIQE